MRQNKKDHFNEMKKILGLNSVIDGKTFISFL